MGTLGFLSQIGPDDGDSRVNGLVLRIAPDFTAGELFAQIALQNRGHQAVNGPTNGGKLLQNRGTIRTCIERMLKRRYLSFDAPDTRQCLLLLFRAVWHLTPVCVVALLKHTIPHYSIQSHNASRYHGMISGSMRTFKC